MNTRSVCLWSFGGERGERVVGLVFIMHEAFFAGRFNYPRGSEVFVLRETYEYFSENSRDVNGLSPPFRLSLLYVALSKKFSTCASPQFLMLTRTKNDDVLVWLLHAGGGFCCCLCVFLHVINEPASSGFLFFITQQQPMETHQIFNPTRWHFLLRIAIHHLRPKEEL